MNKTHAFLLLAAVLILVTSVDAVRGRFLRPDVSSTPTVSGSNVLTLSVATSHGLIKAGGGELFARVDLQAIAPPREPFRAPVRMVLVLDRSGSMNGQKLSQARSAALEMVDLMEPQDALGIVHFGTDVTSHAVVRTDAEGRAQLRSFLAEMQDSGSTNISGGLEAARQLLMEESAVDASRRIVLVSDGQPTTGITDTAGLTALAGSLHAAGIAVSALGVGVDFNSTLMTQLAEVGGGFYAYLNQARELDEVLGKELGQARAVVARSVVLKLTPASGVSVVDVPGRTWTVHGDTLRVQLPDFVPGATAQVFVHLRTRDTATPETGLLGLALDDVDARTGKASVTTASVALALGSAEDFEASRNEAVYAAGLRAQGGRQMVLAAQAFKEGRREQALAMLEGVRNLFGRSSNALAGDSAEAGQAIERWRTMDARDRGAISDESLTVERKQMKSFGNNNTY